MDKTAELQALQQQQQKKDLSLMGRLLQLTMQKNDLTESINEVYQELKVSNPTMANEYDKTMQQVFF